MEHRVDCRLQICPADSHPSGGFPVSDCGIFSCPLSAAICLLLFDL